MARAISNTSPLLYLYRINAIEWLSTLFDGVSIPNAVRLELLHGQQQGYVVPVPSDYRWLSVQDARLTPSEWLALDLGPGELAALSLALENHDQVVLLDDALARRVAQAAGLTVWGTLRVLLEAKERGIATHLSPYIERLSSVGMWLSADVKRRVLALAGE